MMARKRVLFLLLAAFLGGSSSAVAQHAREEFGKNRIQYKKFDWRFVSSDNFDVYFYEGGRKIAKEAIEFLEEEFDRITDLIGYPPYSKTKVFLYNSVTDLQQSNVGLNRTPSSGGETKFVKTYVEVAHPGALDDLKEELLYKVSDIMVNEMMFGGSLKEMFQSAVLLNLPEWFINGASLYVAKGWSIEMDDYIRQLIETKKIKKLNRLSDDEAALAGQSFWNFVVEQYGKSNISNILNYTRVIRNEEKSVAITLGLPFKQVLYEWQNYYTDLSRKVQVDYQYPSEEAKVTKNKGRKLAYNTLKISPDGKKLAYTINDNGKYIVKLLNLETGNEEKVVSGGIRVIEQDIDYDIPLVAWADDNTLGVVNIKHGRIVFLAV